MADVLRKFAMVGYAADLVCASARNGVLVDRADAARVRGRASQSDLLVPFSIYKPYAKIFLHYNFYFRVYHCDPCGICYLRVLCK